MEIVSKIVKIGIDGPVTTEVVESELLNLGITPLRWAIVNIEDSVLTVSLACENLC